MFTKTIATLLVGSLVLIVSLAVNEAAKSTITRFIPVEKYGWIGQVGYALIVILLATIAILLISRIYPDASKI